jgi:hypothetical protein
MGGGNMYPMGGGNVNPGMDWENSNNGGMSGGVGLGMMGGGVNMAPMGGMNMNMMNGMGGGYMQN